MDQALKQRLIGASVIIALAVIFIPMLISSEGTQGSQTITIDIPNEPESLTQKRIQLDKPIKKEPEEKPESVDLSMPIKSVVLDSPGNREEKIIDLVENTPNPQNTSSQVNKKQLKDQPKEQIEEPSVVKPQPKPAKEVAQTSVQKPKQNSIAKNPQDNKQEVKDKPVVKPVSLETLGYQARLGVFSQKQNAEKLKSKILQSGFDAHVIFDESKKLHAVVSPPMLNKKEVEDYIRSIQSLKLNLGKPSIQQLSSEEFEKSQFQIANGFVVQLGSFSKKENALKLRDQLRQKRFVSFVDRSKNAQGSDMFRVRVGPFLTEKDAQANQKQIQRVMKKNGIIKAHERKLVID